MTDIKTLIIRYAVCLYLSLLCIWQAILAWSTNQFVSLFESFGKESAITIILSYSQPLIWIFMILTALISYDIFRRKELLVTNTFAIVASISIATILIQLFVVVGAYTPTLEMGH